MPTTYQTLLSKPQSDIIRDVSHWNQEFDLDKLTKSDIECLIIKAGQGSDGEDPTYEKRLELLDNTGDRFLKGTYFFVDESPADKQVENYLNLADPDGDPSYRLMVDWEKQTVLEGIAEQFVEGLYKKTNRWPILYINKWLMKKPSDILRNCPLNIPKYGSLFTDLPLGWSWDDVYDTNTGVFKLLWQHSDGARGNNPGPTEGLGVCDKTIFFGTKEELRKWWLSN